MKQINKHKTVVVNTTVYSAHVELTPTEAALLFLILNQPAPSIASYLGFEEGWTPKLDQLSYDLWCEFFEDSDMDSTKATGIIDGITK